MKIGILIPVYNEEKNIKPLIEKLNFPKNDIIIVDDGSTDNTWEIVQHMGVTVIKHNKNKGKGMAQKTGFKYAVKRKYDYIITLDGDGQHDPAKVNTFVKKIYSTNDDIIIGERRRSLLIMPIPRYFSNLFVSFIVSFLSHKKIKDAQSGYRALSYRVMKNVPLSTHHFDTECELLIKAARMGYKIGRIEIPTIYKEEKSKINPLIDTIRFVILGFKSIWR